MQREGSLWCHRERSGASMSANEQYNDVKYSKISIAAVAASLLTGAMGLVSCNEHDDTSSESYLHPANLAVTSFKLKYDSKVLGLDSAYFSIDLEHGVIFNADSLRKGTPINKVVANITYGSAVTSAKIMMSGGSTRTGEIDYMANPTDSIDFTGNVQLVLGDDSQNTVTYRLKVNVHQQVADTLVWGETALTTLPSRLGHPKEQKTVKLGDRAVSLIMESDGSYTLASSSDLMAARWTKQAMTFPFTPEIASLVSSTSSLWILDRDGKLYRSADGSDWSDTGETWTSTIGGYTESVVGLKMTDGALTFAQYPLTELNEKTIPADFPVEGCSNFVTLENMWTSSPVAFFAGGRTAANAMSSDTWAFDGSEWTKLGEGGIPAVTGASIIPYYIYRANASGDAMVEYNVWMLIGGQLESGQANRTVYISYNNGVNWATGNKQLQLPEMIPAMVDCDNIVMTSPRSANLSNAWTRMASGQQRIKYEVDGDIISWECPYIYLFGGYDTDRQLYDTVWRGVLNRLTFTPVI